MKTFIAISVLDDKSLIEDQLISLINTPISKEIHVFDATVNGMDSETQKFIKRHSSFGVFYHNLKNTKKEMSKDFRLNVVFAESILLFKLKNKEKFSEYIHVGQNIFFNDHDLIDFCQKIPLFNCLSPLIFGEKGFSAIKGMFDRFGIEYVDGDETAICFITGDIEDSFALNPLCFGISRRVSNAIQKITFSLDSPVNYINSLIFDYWTKPQKIDTSVVAFENLY